MLELKFVDVENGWVFAKLENDNWSGILENSYLFSNDVIRDLLNLIVVFAMEKSYEESILWNGESQYYLCKYVLDKDNVTTSIYYCDNSCTEYIVNTKTLSNKGTKVFEETYSVWFWGKAIYDEIIRFLNEEYYEKRSGFKMPHALLKEASKIYG